MPLDPMQTQARVAVADEHYERVCKIMDVPLDNPDALQFRKLAEEGDEAVRDIWACIVKLPEERIELTADETKFARKLKDSGKLESLMASEQIETSSISTEAIRTAITDMDRMTETIVKHRAALRSHGKGLLATFGNGAGSAQVAHLNSMKSVTESYNEIERKVEGMRLDVESRARQYEQSIRESESMDSARSSAQRNSLDRRPQISPAPYAHLLAKLQALGSELKTDDPKDTETIQAARFHANELVFLSVSTCRKSLNHVFSEAAKSYSATASKTLSYSQVVDRELLEILEEIQSLWDEAVPVAHMAVEKEFLQPILSRTDSVKQENDIQRKAITLYIQNCLDFVNERFAVMVSRLELAVYHHECLITAFNTIETKPQRNPDQPQRNKATGEKRALANIWRAIQQFGGMPNPTESSKDQFIELQKYLQARTAKGETIAQSVHTLFEAAIKAGLDNVELASQILLDCLTADSRAGSGEEGAVLVDAQTEESIAYLQAQQAEIEELSAKLKLDAPAPLQPPLTEAYKRALEHLASCADETKKIPKAGDKGVSAGVAVPTCGNMTNIIERWA